jgi:hypothetical protein
MAPNTLPHTPPRTTRTQSPSRPRKTPKPTQTNFSGLRYGGPTLAHQYVNAYSSTTGAPLSLLPASPRHGGKKKRTTSTKKRTTSTKKRTTSTKKRTTSTKKRTTRK